MRCDELQNRFNEFSGKRADLSDEILEHLSQCEACSKLAEKYFILDEIMQAVSEQPEADLMPLEQRLQMVVKKADSAKWSDRLGEFINRIAELVSYGHGRLALYSSLVSMVLIFVTLVPFGYNRVVGYNLTIGNICPEVASDDEIVCALLHEQGISQAVIDITECDTTCSLMIFDLQSEEEIKLTMATYQELGAEATIEHVAIITNRDSRSLLSLAKSKIFNNN